MLISQVESALNGHDDEAPLDDAYAQFRERYFDRPDLFVLECIKFKKNESPAPYQLKALREIVTHHRLSIRGPHSMGKTAFLSWVILWFALTRDIDYDWKVPVTASVYRQLKEFLWPEVHKWANRLRWSAIGRAPYDPRTELLTLNLNLKTGAAFCMAVGDETALEGAHATQLLYIIDEAKAVPTPVWDAVEGALANDGIGGAMAFCLSCSTPGDTAGRFYEIHVRRKGTLDWFVFHVTKDEAIAAGRMSIQWAQDRADQWGEDSALYKNRVEGQFASSASDVVIPLEWVEAANLRWEKAQGKGSGQYAYGVDVARQGDDLTVITTMHGRVLEALEDYAGLRITETTGRVISTVNQNRVKNAPIGVDVIGFGAGVFDALIEADYNAFEVNVAEATDETDETNTQSFQNLRAYLWWLGRWMLNPKNPNAVAIPDHERLTQDLCAPTYKYLMRGQIAIEKKEDTKKRTGVSPDFADSFLLALYVLWGGGQIDAGTQPKAILDYRG